MSSKAVWLRIVPIVMIALAATGLCLHTPIQLRFDVPDFVMRAVGDDYLQPEQALWLQLDPAALAIIGH